MQQRQIPLDAQYVKYRNQNRRKSIWKRIVGSLACLVVFCTTYLLILPAITMEQDTFCGQEAHTHSEECYAPEPVGDLICETEEAEGHTHGETCYLPAHAHTEECYAPSEVLTCALAEVEAHTHGESCYGVEYPVVCTVEESEGHTHDESCYITENPLICGTEETAGHTHGADCYRTERPLVCGTAESQGHTHGNGCYSEITSVLTCTEEGEDHVHGDACYSLQGGELICALAETEGHTHGEACYGEAVETCVCTLAETEGHTHSDSCYGEAVKTCVCTLAETEGHTHGEVCYGEGVEAIICGLEETQGHTHDETCYTIGEDVLSCGLEEREEAELACQLEESEGHTHSEECYAASEETEPALICELEEHTHELSCYSDPTADVETAADWEKTLANLELTGVWREDILTVAQSQLGYTESTKNYVVMEDGETIKGYTRYGQWYGYPYGDWCAMFVSFCLNYAEVEDIPLDCNCQNWTEALSTEEYGLYRSAGDYTPEPGDLIFFDMDGDGTSDHVGLVKELTEATEETPVQVVTIEGNYQNRVSEVSRDLTDETIVGYGRIPVQLTDEEQAALDHVIGLIDAMPSADEIDEKIAEYEAAEDYDGLEVWYAEVVQQVAETYMYYSHLSDAQKEAVTNADKLLELEYIWSVSQYYIVTDDIVSDAPTTVTAAKTSEFIDLNLYDYGSNINTLYSSNNKYPGFQWNGGAYAKSGLTESLYVDDESRTSADRNVIDSIDFGNSMITDMTYGSSSSGSNGRSTNASIVGKSDGSNGAINKLDVSTYGTTNRPIGMSLNSSITSTSADVLQRTLGDDGYPALTDGTSLAYLFTQNTYATKKNTASIDGLFQQDSTSGEYFYNSRWNHAQYSNNKFTLYNQIITPNFITYPFGNFLPLNDITSNSTSTQVSKITSMSDYIQATINDLVYSSDYSSNPTKQQLLDMLAMYRTNVKYYGINGKTWSTFSAKDAIVDYFCGDQDGDNPSDDTSLITDALLAKMYNIDWDVKTNFFFGMDMSMNFMQPKGGYTGNDTNGDGESDYPMVFYFTGDDDVWVYIDGVLFLDLSGIHRHVGGKIDFVNGKVYYYYLDTANTGDVSITPYQTYTFAQILSAAGKSTDGLNANGTFKDYTTHSFKFYYMERGSGSSVCRLNFNFPLLRQNSISVSKAVTADTAILGNPDYKFQVLKANSDGTKTSDLFIAAGTTYTIYDANDNVIGTGTTDANGVFTLKAGQRAEFIGIKENAGKYYVRELLEGTVLGQYGNVTVSGESTTTSNNVTVGSDTFTGMDSPVKDMSDGATSFRFTNDVDEDQLGELNISKVLTEYPQTRGVRYYDIQVTLDGEPLPVGTAYTVDGETRTVTTAGIITIAADETATISNILAGTQFAVQETSGSAEGYTVTYTDSGGYTITVNDGVVTGVIKTSANVQLVVTNTEKGTSVTIPGTKSLINPDGQDHAYTFSLTEVTDSTGATEKEGGLSGYEATATVNSETANFQFDIHYAQVDMASLPAKFYYRITENGADDSLANDTMYVAEVTVTEVTDGIAAEVTGMWKDGTKLETLSADFTNTLVGSLSLEKQVVGTTPEGGFNFTIALDVGASGLESLPTQYAATFYNQDGTVETTVTLNEGKISLNGFMAGEKAVIHGIPYGATWTITETTTDGYIVTHTVDGTEGSGATSSGTIAMGTTEVVYTNSQTYALPETGGAGTHLYTAVGFLLVLCGAALLLYKLKKRGREAF